METIKNIIHATQDTISSAASVAASTASVAATTAASTLSTDSSKIQSLKEFEIDDSAQGNILTTNFGTHLSNTEESLKAGERGPTLLEDFHFREKMNHFDHERIPERVVHARGAAAHGYFQVYENLEEITKAKVFSDPTKQTPVFVRFSTVLGSRGSADTPRDVRGFAVKFYTDEGNWDLVGNNIPVFFVQDAIKFVDLIHAGKPEPHNEIPQAQSAHDNFWDWVGFSPESAHMIMWVLSDRALPRTFSQMQGFGVHSFIMVNKQGKRRFVKFHWLPVLGTQSMVWDESQKLTAVDPDFQRRDLTDSIDQGIFPEWELGLQIVEEEDEHKFEFDILDSTKIIPEELVPIRKVGKMVLNRNVSNYFAETEQVAYCTHHLVPGIESSNDPLLQGRNFSYLDTQMIRLGGPNFQEIPINRPVCPVTNNQRDGFHRMTINKSRVNYSPNRFGCPALDPTSGYVHSPAIVNGPKIRARGPKFFDFYSQARLFFNSLTDWERKHLTQAAIFELGHVDDVGVRERAVALFDNIDRTLACEVAFAVGVEAPAQSKAQTHNNKTKNVSLADLTKTDSIKGKKIAFLIGNGYKSKQLAAMRAAVTAAGAVVFIVGPHKGAIPGDATDVEKATAQFAFTATRSVQYDAVIFVGGKHISALAQTGEVLAFINESFKHGKPIIAVDEAVNLIDGLSLPGAQLATGDQVVSHEGIVTVRNLAEEAITMDGDAPSFGKAVFRAIAAHRFPLRDISRVPA